MRLRIARPAGRCVRLKVRAPRGHRVAAKAQAVEGKGQVEARFIQRWRHFERPFGGIHGAREIFKSGTTAIASVRPSDVGGGEVGVERRYAWRRRAGGLELRHRRVVTTQQQLSHAERVHVVRRRIGVGSFLDCPAAASNEKSPLATLTATNRGRRRRVRKPSGQPCLKRTTSTHSIDERLDA